MSARAEPNCFGDDHIGTCLVPTCFDICLQLASMQFCSRLFGVSTLNLFKDWVGGFEQKEVWATNQVLFYIHHEITKFFRHMVKMNFEIYVTMTKVMQRCLLNNREPILHLVTNCITMLKYCWFTCLCFFINRLIIVFLWLGWLPSHAHLYL